MTVVMGADNTYAQIEILVRELTASASEASLPSTYIQKLVNQFYNSDMPYAIKLDQMRSVYTFYTRPYIDKYPLDVNYNQGIRAPFYVEGVQGYFYKDRDEFFRMWPRWPTKFNFGSTSLTAGITNVTQANPAQVTSPNHGLTSGNTVYINNVVGMTQLNGNSYTITVVNANNFTLGVDSTLFTAYVSGGTGWLTPVQFSFLVPGPFLRSEVVIGGVDINGNPISIADDGNGNLWLQETNPVVSIPSYGALYQPPSPQAGRPIPGMFNQNTLNPGLEKQTNIGSVDYVIGNISFTNPLPLQVGTTLTVWVSQYQPGRPYTMLFWNNYFLIRPVPKLIHKIEIEAYLTPVQFMMTTDTPILNQWVEYIAYGCAREILRRRQDMEGVANLEEGFRRQEGLVLERQGVEEINSRNKTIFAGSQLNNGWNNGWQTGWY